MAALLSSAEAYRLTAIPIHDSGLVQLNNQGIFDRITQKIEKEETEKQEAVEFIQKQ